MFNLIFNHIFISIQKSISFTAPLNVTTSQTLISNDQLKIMELLT